MNSKYQGRSSRGLKSTGMSRHEQAAARRRKLIRSQRDSQVKIRTAPMRSSDGDFREGASSASVEHSTLQRDNNSEASPNNTESHEDDHEEQLRLLRLELEEAKARSEEQRELARRLACERDELEQQLSEARNSAADQRLIAQEMKTATEHLKRFAADAAAERDRLKMEARLAEKDDLLWKLQVTNKWS